MHREAKYCLGQFAVIGVVSREMTEWANREREISIIARHLHESPDTRTTLASIAVGFLCTIISHPDDVIKVTNFFFF